MAGVGFILLVRSPFRAPIGERLFRRVWLGPFGRWFIRGAMKQKGATGPEPTTSPNAARPATAQATPVVRSQPRLPAPAQLTTFAPDPRIDRIEAMLTELTKRLDQK
jgi:hypothetical protein